MKSAKLSISVLGLVGLFLAGQVFAGTFHWANSVIEGDPPPFFPNDALGSPDMRWAAFVTEETNATFSSFEVAGEFVPAELAALLGVSIEVVEQSDFLAFESMGSAYPHFEDSSWTFQSGSFSETVLAPDEALATGYVEEEAYADYFGIESRGKSFLWAFILVDLDQVSGLADDFSVRVQGAYGPYGRPEPDAMATLDGALVPVAEATWGQVKSLFR